MAAPVWDPAVEAWTTSVTCPAYGDINVEIKTDGETTQPSERQLHALSLIASLQAAARKSIRKDVKRYAKEILDEEEMEDFEAEDFDTQFTDALIPNLRNSESTYFFLSGEFDIDMEHGIVCLCRDGEAFRVCDSAAKYEPYQLDDTETLDALFSSE
jgi:hypothetical protein